MIFRIDDVNIKGYVNCYVIGYYIGDKRDISRVRIYRSGLDILFV